MSVTEKSFERYQRLAVEQGKADAAARDSALAREEMAAGLLPAPDLSDHDRRRRFGRAVRQTGD